jgi:hypothetical protein
VIAFLVVGAWAVACVALAAVPYRWRAARRRVDRMLSRPAHIAGWEARPEAVRTHSVDLREAV